MALPIQPGPLPLVTQTGVARIPEGRVVLKFQTPGGTSFYYLSPEHARVVAQELLDAATKAAIEIVQQIPSTNGHGDGPGLLRG